MLKSLLPLYRLLNLGHCKKTSKKVKKDIDTSRFLAVELFSNNMTDNHYSKVHHTLLNVMVLLYRFHFYCLKTFLLYFLFYFYLIVTFLVLTCPVLSPSENREMHFILFFFFFNFFLYLPSPLFLRLRKPALVK